MPKNLADLKLDDLVLAPRILWGGRYGLKGAWHSTMKRWSIGVVLALAFSACWRTPAFGLWGISIVTAEVLNQAAIGARIWEHCGERKDVLFEEFDIELEMLEEMLRKDCEVLSELCWVRRCREYAER